MAFPFLKHLQCLLTRWRVPFLILYTQKRKEGLSCGKSLSGFCSGKSGVAAAYRAAFPVAPLAASNKAVAPDGSIACFSNKSITSLLECCSLAAGEQQRYVLCSVAMKDTSKAQDEVVVAIVWYRPEQWQRVRDIATDADQFEDSYSEWLALAEERARELRNTGLRVEKVDLDSEKLIFWCNKHGLENNAEARTRYAAERLSELEKGKSLVSRRT